MQNESASSLRIWRSATPANVVLFGELEVPVLIELALDLLFVLKQRKTRLDEHCKPGKD